MSESDAATPWLEPDDSPQAAEGWPLRPLLLALLGLATGYAIYLIMHGDFNPKPTTLQATELVALIAGAGLLGFTLERRLWWASLAFALVAAVVAGGIMWWNGDPDHWGGGDGWRLFSLFAAILIAAPLFQTARDNEGFSFSYAQVHDHAWANIVLWGACWLFVLIVWLLSWLLASLFLLIDIHLLRELLEKEWFVCCLIGLAFGGALGLLREHDFVVRLLQRVVATVLAVLAPVLAVGLILFLLALPFTGLAPLWKQGYATATLLACAAGALILANVVIGSTPDQERRFPALRFGAMGLAVVVLPLAVLAAVAIGLRINQYGFSPERLWALTFVVIASAFGLAYLVSLARGRMEWADKVRPANLILAFAVCAIALVLSTPLISFNAISTRDQVARLESGKVAPDKFDWAALAFDFGEAGRKELARLATSANAAIKAKAVEVAKAGNRWDVVEPDRTDEKRQQLAANLRILPQGATLPVELRDEFAGNSNCTGNAKCTLLMGNGEAWLFQDACFANTASEGHGPESLSFTPHWCYVGRYRLADGKWVEDRMPRTARDEAERTAFRKAYGDGKVEVRTVPRRQVFVGDVPVGEPFE